MTHQPGIGRPIASGPRSGWQTCFNGDARLGACSGCNVARRTRTYGTWHSVCGTSRRDNSCIANRIRLPHRKHRKGCVTSRGKRLRSGWDQRNLRPLQCADLKISQFPNTSGLFTLEPDTKTQRALIPPNELSGKNNHGRRRWVPFSNESHRTPFETSTYLCSLLHVRGIR